MNELRLAIFEIWIGERETHNYVTDFEIPISNRHHRTQYSRFKSNSNKRKMIDTFDGISVTCESNKIDMPLKNSTARGIFAWDMWQLCFLNPDLTRFDSLCLLALECVSENSLNSLHWLALLEQPHRAPSSSRFAFIWMNFWLSDHHHRQCDYANAALYMSKNRQRPIENHLNAIHLQQYHKLIIGSFLIWIILFPFTIDCDVKK